MQSASHSPDYLHPTPPPPYSHYISFLHPTHLHNTVSLAPKFTPHQSPHNKVTPLTTFTPPPHNTVSLAPTFTPHQSPHSSHGPYVQLDSHAPLPAVPVPVPADPQDGQGRPAPAQQASGEGAAFIHVENHSSSCLCARSGSSTRSTADTTIFSGISSRVLVSSSPHVQLSVLYCTTLLCHTPVQ